MESVAKTTYRIINELLYGRKMNSFARCIRSPLSFRRSGASTAAFLLLDRLHKEVETEKASTTDQHQDPFLLHVLREYRIYQRMSSTGNWETMTESFSHAAPDPQLRQGDLRPLLRQ